MSDDVVRSDVVAEGRRLIDRWIAMREGVERDRARLITAQCELSDAETELAKWMLPEDAKPGEKICIWHVDSLIQVCAPDPSDPDHRKASVTIRTRGNRGLRP